MKVKIAEIIARGKGGDTISSLLGNDSCESDIARGISEENECVLIGIESSNGATSYLMGAVNGGDRFSMILGDKSLDEIIEQDNISEIVNSSKLLQQTYKELVMEHPLCCDKNIAKDVLEKNVDAVNNFESFIKRVDMTALVKSDPDIKEYMSAKEQWEEDLELEELSLVGAMVALRNTIETPSHIIKEREQEREQEMQKLMSMKKETATPSFPQMKP